jgi:type IX secretion system PorP/SprF family membrane protein
MKNIIINSKKAALILSCLFVTQHVKAQYDAMFTQYMFNEMFINPAYAGSKEAMSATLLHRQQWVSFPGRPVTTSFALHGPVLENKMGLGLSVLNEKIGVLNRSLIYGSYAYRLTVHEGGTLALGLMGGIENQVNEFSKLKLTDVANAPADPMFSSNTPNILGANFGTGVYYTTSTFYAGLSIPRILDNELRYNYRTRSDIKITSIKPSRFTYYLTLGNVFKINNDLRIKANTMVKAVQNAHVQVDIGASALIKETVWAGFSYRTKSSLSLLLGFQANNQLLINYAYDYGVNKIQNYSQGSHEIVLNYLFSFKERNVITPRYF